MDDIYGDGESRMDESMKRNASISAVHPVDRSVAPKFIDNQCRDFGERMMVEPRHDKCLDSPDMVAGSVAKASV